MPSEYPPSYLDAAKVAITVPIPADVVDDNPISFGEIMEREWRLQNFLETDEGRQAKRFSIGWCYFSGSKTDYVPPPDPPHWVISNETRDKLMQHLADEREYLDGEFGTHEIEALLAELGDAESVVPNDVCYECVGTWQ